MKNYLEFEKEIKSLEEEVDNLKKPFWIRRYIRSRYTKN